jgi:hypothetical protein
MIPGSYLLPVLLIITAVALFLCILNLLSLRELSGRMRDFQQRENNTSGEVLAPKKPVGPGMEIDRGTPRDITSGIGMIVGKYHLDSLVIASRDGLLVASAGSGDPESEAAYYSDLLSRGATIPDTRVRLVEFAHRGMPLIGIARGSRLSSAETEQQMTTDIRSLFETQM